MKVYVVRGETSLNISWIEDIYASEEKAINAADSLNESAREEEKDEYYWVDSRVVIEG